MKPLFIVMLLGITWRASARLGESEEQLTNRYGVPIEIGTNAGLRTLSFDFGEYFVQAHERDGKSVVEITALKKDGVDLSDRVALAIASRMAGSTNWTAVETGKSMKSWTIKQSGFFASLSRVPGKPQAIMVSTVDELLRAAREKAAETEKKASGF